MTTVVLMAGVAVMVEPLLETTVAGFVVVVVVVVAARLGGGGGGAETTWESGSLTQPDNRTSMQPVRVGIRKRGARAAIDEGRVRIEFIPEYKRMRGPVLYGKLRTRDWFERRAEFSAP